MSNPREKAKLLTAQLQLQITSTSLWTAGMAVGGAGACLPLTVAARASQTQTLRSWRAIPRLFLSSLQQAAQAPALTPRIGEEQLSPPWP